MQTLSRRIEIPQDAISAVIPVWRFGHAVAEVTVHVRAASDQALGGLTASDIYIEDINGDIFAAPDCLKRAILDEVRDYDRGSYDQIVSAASNPLAA